MARLRHILPWAAACILLAAGSNVRAGSVSEARDALYTGYAEKLADLATRCDKQGQAALAEQVRGGLPKRERATLYLFELTSSTSDEPPVETNKEKVSAVLAEFRKLRGAQADALVGLAGRAIKEAQPSLAFELVQEAARENPDHKEARRLLGYVRFREAWHTPYEVRQFQVAKVWHPKFGWLPKSQVARFESGERFDGKRWLSAAEDARQHADMDHAWQLESEHYRLRTDRSREEGVQLLAQLERLYQCWQQVFMGYAVGEKELARWFAGSEIRRESHPHKVVYFRSREEYNDTLLSAQPLIASTLGIYIDETHTAYFFAGDAQNEGTLFHEATHQLFQETRTTSKEAGRASNFWVIEGIACYMETLKPHGGGMWTLGGVNAGRMPAARKRLEDDHFYVPLAKLVARGMNEMRQDPDLAPIYSQSAGLAEFLMHHDHGRYREPLMGYLEAVYSGHAVTQTLSRQTGKSYEDLDREYAAFLDSGE
jgi:hypothetical protein